MPYLRLDALRTKLLRAGVAPRHVRRYLGELAQHFDDLLRAETGNGLSGEAAFQAARARLGSDEELAAAMLARPELRSIGARFPWAVFGIAPVVSLGLLLLAAVFVEVGVMKTTHPGPGHIPGWVVSFVTAWDWAMMYAPPVIVAAIFYIIGARQLMTMRWLVPGVFLSALLSTAVTSSTIFSNLPGKSAFTVGFWLSTEDALPRLAASVLPVLLMSVLYWLWQRRTSAAADQSSA